MYGTRDDVLSPGPYAHLPQSRSPYRLSTEAGAGTVTIDNNEENNESDNDDNRVKKEEPSEMLNNTNFLIQKFWNFRTLAHQKLCHAF